MLKKIGTNARYEMEKMLDAKVNLKLWVKVKKDWRDSDFLIKKFRVSGGRIKDKDQMMGFQYFSGIELLPLQTIVMEVRCNGENLGNILDNRKSYRLSDLSE